ncbi:glycerol-3-phosphate acyltransferase [Bacteroidetes/Chlorobi group bacterium Naka2016]|jgi:glycerol-3-phosphate acyltransferase PlsY|nr:MAG: glycerol-3-phosphate acyltransferase [Bacteroidetes/Chlorobi group bacterium Naka2016]
MYQFILLGLFSYLLGSIPFAYIFVKLISKKNILKEGSGNVGAFNVYDTTKNIALAILVFLFDFFKGFVPILVSNKFFPQNDFSMLIAGCSAVLGHNYSIFLLFKGGKGLATSFGVLFLVQPIVSFIWFIFWLIIYNFIKKDMDFANPIATILTPFASFLIPESFVYQSAFYPFESKIVLFIAVGIIALIIVSKYTHIVLSSTKKK